MTTTSGVCHEQGGWILVIGLIILTMLTIISMAIMRTTLLEERMTGTAIDINLSFQSAEIALRNAESFIENQNDNTLFNTSSLGLYAEGTDQINLEPDPFDTKWGDKNSREVTNKPSGVKSAPRFMAKRIGQIGGEGSLNIGGYGSTNLSTKSVIYRITAKGTGGSDTTQTILRSYYAKSQ